MALNSIDDLKDGRMSPPPLRASSDNFVCVSFIGRQLNLDCSTIAKRVHHALHARLALLDGLNVCLPLLHVLSKANARNKVRTFQRVSPGQIIRSDHADDKGRLLCWAVGPFGCNFYRFYHEITLGRAAFYLFIAIGFWEPLAYRLVLDYKSPALHCQSGIPYFSQRAASFCSSGR